MRPDVAAWLARARADAEARGLPALVPLLEALARSTSALRDAEIGHAAPEGPVHDASRHNASVDTHDASDTSD